MYNISLELTLALNPCHKNKLKISIDHINCVCRKLMWVIILHYILLSYIYIVMKLYHLGQNSPREDSTEDPWSSLGLEPTLFPPRLDN